TEPSTVHKDLLNVTNKSINKMQLKDKVSSLQVALSDLLVTTGNAVIYHISNGFPANSSTHPVATSRS
ncbi:hypothetical protein A2U01_0040760, partial [Trifolium medium]|nr:hypothetical protein [Trifolium medium]